MRSDAGQVGSGDRAEKIRTYNYPQGRVTDHRIALSEFNLPEVMDGALDTFIEGLAAQEQRETLAAGRMTIAQAQRLNVFRALNWAKRRVSGARGRDSRCPIAAGGGAIGRAECVARPSGMGIGRAGGGDFRQAVERRARGEPMAYILGRRAFYDREFRVTPATLIPRPETELLLEAALASLTGAGAGNTVADIGTGCGALAICFAAHRPGARVLGSDISAAALAVARQNGAEQGVAVEWECGDLLCPWRERGLRLDRVLANLPYIATEELAALEVSGYEPRLALDGGADGLSLIGRLLRELPAVCAPRAQAWLEIGAGQGEAVLALVAAQLPKARASLLRDYAGHDRVLQLQLP